MLDLWSKVILSLLSLEPSNLVAVMQALTPLAAMALVAYALYVVHKKK